MGISLLTELCQVNSPSGHEYRMRDYILNYVHKNRNRWHSNPKILMDNTLHDCLGLSFGSPKVAVFAHMDTVGFMVRYQDQLVPIGSPEINENNQLVGEDSMGIIECNIRIDSEHRVYHRFMRGIDTGTALSFKPYFRQEADLVRSPGLDNRIGLWNVLKLAETIENAIIFFSCWEEQGGGSVSYLTRLMYEEYHISKALIADVTWVTNGIRLGEGVVISLKDEYIPRHKFVREIIDVANENKINYQLEVEGEGSSDGGEIQRSPYPVDWCFIGIPCMNIHSDRETINTRDLYEMLRFYRLLTKQA